MASPCLPPNGENVITFIYLNCCYRRFGRTFSHQFSFSRPNSHAKIKTCLHATKKPCTRYATSSLIFSAVWSLTSGLHCLPLADKGWHGGVSYAFSRFLWVCLPLCHKKSLKVKFWVVCHSCKKKFTRDLFVLGSYAQENKK